MQLDDLLGLLFLFFFIILPAIQGFMRRGRQMPDDFEPDDIPLPGEGRANQPTSNPPQPTQSSQPTPSRAPAPTAPPRPTSPAPSRTPPPPPRPTQAQQPTPRAKTLEQIERERLARQGQPQTPPQPSRPAQPQPRVAPAAVAVVQRRKGEHWEFSNTPHDIVNGMVWQQILSEPRSQHWRKIRKPRR